MWSTLIEILDKRLRDRPHKKLLRDILQLRDAMTNCQHCYETYKRVETEKSHIEWSNSVEYMVTTLLRVDPVLGIFNSDACNRIWSYLGDECGLLSEEEAITIIGFLACDLEEAAGRNAEGGDALVEAHRKEPLGMWRAGRLFEMGSASREYVVGDFKEALAHLDQFIRSHFSPAEIHKAATSIWSRERI
jgi:hypothetical protein